MLTKSFCALSKTSLEVFGADWKRAGELYPLPAVSLWTAAVQALSCSFKLTIHIKLTKKGILKSNTKNLKAGGKSLTFDVASICVQTKAGRFLTGKVGHQPFAKKIRVEKQFTKNHQSYILVQVSGNIYGVQKYNHFVEKFCEMIGVVVDFEKALLAFPTLAVLNHIKDARLRTNHQH